jgi:DNA-binding NtrC family response regulator
MKLPRDMHVCLVDPNPSLGEAIRPMFAAAGAHLHEFPSAESYLRSSGCCGPRPVVVVAAAQPGMNGLELLGCIRRLRPHLPVLMLVDIDDVRTAVAAIRLGAADVVATPVPLTRLLRSMVSNSLEGARAALGVQAGGGDCAATNK